MMEELSAPVTVVEEDLSQSVQEKKDLYEFEIDRFKELLEKDRKYAFQRYGWTLFYSLEPSQTFQLMQEMDWQGKEALDYYNVGALLCQEENYKEAKKNFEKAESMGCEQPELFFNMAMLYEIDEDKNNAKKYYQKYIDASEQWDEIPKSLQKELDEVREHLKSL